MEKHFLKLRKVFTNVACPPLILILNNSELAAKYLPKDFEHSITTLEIKNTKNSLFQGFDNQKEKDICCRNNKNLVMRAFLYQR